MFIFRSLTLILSILGYIFGGITIYLGFNPIQFPSQEMLNLGTLLNCTAPREKYTVAQLSDSRVNDLKTRLGQNLPVETIRDFTSSLESIVSSIGSTTEVNIESCDYNSSANGSINKINSELQGKKKYYEFGTLEQFVTSFNELPFAKISNIKINVASTFARSNICNKAINTADFYLFTALDIAGLPRSKVVLFTISLRPKEDAKIHEKMISNIIISGHYLKARFACNG